MIAVGAFAGSSGGATSSVSAIEPASLARAQTIRASIDARYRALGGSALAVTEATSTRVVESFALMTPDLVERRFIPAANGIWYAICPVGATCPYPAHRSARPPAGGDRARLPGARNGVPDTGRSLLLGRSRTRSRWRQE